MKMIKVMSKKLVKKTLEMLKQMAEDDEEYDEIPRPAQLTPDEPFDDCNQDLAWEDEDEEWFKSPLSRAYKKAPHAIPRLEGLGLLFVE